MGYFVIGLLFELVLIVAAGNFIDGGHYGAASSFALCSIIFAIYQVGYLIIWYDRKKQK